MELLKRTPEECVMVAAHTYDLRAAKGVGMRTVYLQRWSEDRLEDMDVVRHENNWFIDARKAIKEVGGLLDVCEILAQS